MSYTEDQLQAALVRAFPEKLDRVFVKLTAVGTNANDGYFVCRWRDGIRAVTEFEWPAIVGMVKRALPQVDRNRYCGRLFCNAVNEGLFAEHFTTWQQEATALAEIGAIKVEQ